MENPPNSQRPNYPNGNSNSNNNRGPPAAKRSRVVTGAGSAPPAAAIIDPREIVLTVEEKHDPANSILAIIAEIKKPAKALNPQNQSKLYDDIEGYKRIEAIAAVERVRLEKDAYPANQYGGTRRRTRKTKRRYYSK